MLTKRLTSILIHKGHLDFYEELSKYCKSTSASKLNKLYVDDQWDWVYEDMANNGPAFIAFIKSKGLMQTPHLFRRRKLADPS